MLAYHKVASQVGISDRSVRENIKKLVEQGYLVASDNWYVLNLDCEFIRYIVKFSTEVEHEASLHETELCDASTVPSTAMSVPRASTVIPRASTMIPEATKASFERVSPRTLAYKSVSPNHRVEIAQESVSKFRQMFGNDADLAMDFFKSEVLKNQ